MEMVLAVDNLFAEKLSYLAPKVVTVSCVLPVTLKHLLLSTESMFWDLYVKKKKLDNHWFLDFIVVSKYKLPQWYETLVHLLTFMALQSTAKFKMNLCVRIAPLL